jgi:hypothetical protein
MGRCDQLGNGMGYGVIMADDGNGNAALENMSTYDGITLNGAFTVWYRRPRYYKPDGSVVDFGLFPPTAAGGLSDNNPSVTDFTQDTVIVVSEGVAPAAPIAGESAQSASFGSSIRAVQVVEATLYTGPRPLPCNSGLTGQAGSGSGGAGVDPCARLRETISVAGTSGNATYGRRQTQQRP